MADDSSTETTRQSWFSRMGGAISGMVFGGFLFLAAFPFLMWNENRAIHREQTLQAGSKQVVSVPAAPIATGNEGKLIYVTGTMVANGPAVDRNLKFQLPPSNCIAMSRCTSGQKTRRAKPKRIWAEARKR